MLKAQEILIIEQLKTSNDNTNPISYLKQIDYYWAVSGAQQKVGSLILREMVYCAGHLTSDDSGNQKPETNPLTHF